MRQPMSTANAMPTEAMRMGSRLEQGFLEGLIEALQNKQSELAISFQRTSIGIPSLHASVELNGTINVSVHLRDLSDGEKQAFSQRAVSMISHSK
jgi:hypothetical protein